MIEGEVDGVAIKKRVLRAVAAVPEVRAVVDRLHVRPAAVVGDREIRDHVARAFVAEPAFAELALFERGGENVEPIRASPIDVHGRLEIEVRDGRVTLTGVVPSDEQRRMAEADLSALFGVDEVTNQILVHR